MSHCYIHLPKRRPRPKVADASPVQKIEKEITQHKRLMSIMEKHGKGVGEFQRKLAFLEDELAKAKAQA